MNTAKNTMQRSGKYKKYNVSLLILTALFVALTLLTIIKTTDAYKASNPIIQEAVDWQSRTKGTAAMSANLTTAFKHIAGKNYINEGSINTVVFGSSTAMGIRDSSLPQHYELYNFATNANPLSKSIGEVNYFIESNENIRFVIIGFDYSIAYAFRKTPIEEYQPDIKRDNISFIKVLQDAITLDRLKITIRNLWQRLTVEKNVYNCPENDGIGWDFGTTREPGKCDGFRHDGSATFHYKRLSEVEWKNNLSAEGLKRYINSLNRSSGEINESYLSELTKINTRLIARSGQLIVLLPPLMPNAERFIMDSPTGSHLRRFKSDIEKWAQTSGVHLIDAGQSERFGCLYNEFYDAHHAHVGCYDRVFEHFPVLSAQ